MYYFILFETGKEGFNLGMFTSLNEADAVKTAIHAELLDSKIVKTNFEITNYTIFEKYKINSINDHILTNEQIKYSALNASDEHNLYIVGVVSNKLNYKNIERIRIDNSTIYSRELDDIVKLGLN
jgi:hypothetical protein